MMQGIPSRHASTTAATEERRAQRAEGSSSEVTSGATETIDDPEPAYQRGARSQYDDPYDPNLPPQTRGTTTSQPTSDPRYTQAPAVQPTSSGFYQQAGTTLHPTTTPASVGSETGTYSEGEYEIDPQGQFRRDSRGNRIRYQDPGSDNDTDEHDVSAERARELAHMQQYGHAPVSGVEYLPASTEGARHATAAAGEYGPSDPAYTGEGYGSGWESVPRHHHPTRLSDVLEEDEHSRTSASQMSRRE